MAVEPDPPISGLVMALQANFCQVGLDVPGPGGVEQLLCVRRTRLGKAGRRILVGDRVVLDGVDWPAGRGAVTAVAPRISRLERPAVANCDRVVVVVSLAQPALDPLQLTRFLLTAEASGQPVELVLSKRDLLPPEALEAWCGRLRDWGYEPLPISVRSGLGLDALRSRLARPGLAVLCGPSGVGKSSLLNALLPALALRVGAVSGRLQRGRHTTRHVELFPLARGALLADTPGFNRPDLPRDPVRLASFFPEIRSALAEGGCRFRNCLHLGDPGCQVGTAWDRHRLYGQCLEALLEDRSGREGGASDTGVDRPDASLRSRLTRARREPSRRRRRQQEGTDPSFSPPGPAG